MGKNLCKKILSLEKKGFMGISKNNLNIKFLKIVLKVKNLQCSITLIAELYKFVDEVLIIFTRRCYEQFYFSVYEQLYL